MGRQLEMSRQMEGFNRVPCFCFCLMIVTLILICGIDFEEATITLPANMGVITYQSVHTKEDVTMKGNSSTHEEEINGATVATTEENEPLETEKQGETESIEKKGVDQKQTNASTVTPAPSWAVTTAIFNASAPAPTNITTPAASETTPAPTLTATPALSQATPTPSKATPGPEKATPAPSIAVVTPAPSREAVTPAPSRSPAKVPAPAEAAASPKSSNSKPAKATTPKPTHAASTESPAQELLDIKSLIQDKKYEISVLGGSGLGSQMINMLAQKVYFTKHGSGFIADDTQFGYRWDADTGVLTGYFSPKFPVFKKGDWQQMQKDLGVPDQDKIFQFDSVYREVPQLEITSTIRFPFRRHFWKEFGRGGRRVYDVMAPEACEHLQYNDQAKREMQKLIDHNNVPDLKNGKSASFHVRRGDKITSSESVAFTGFTYVDKFLSVTKGKPIEHCFIASGDYAAVEEVKEALVERNVTCKVHTLTKKLEHGADGSFDHSGRADTIEFLAEISKMVEAAYFVGTFNSNVGSLVSLLRHCIYPTKNYGNSFGVDSKDWFYER